MKKLTSLVPMVLAAVLLAVPCLQSSPAQDTPLAESAPAVAEFLPDNTIIFLHLADVSATVKGYEGSNLKKIVDAPETAVLYSAAWKAIVNNASKQTGGEDNFKQGLGEFLEATKPLSGLLDGEAFISWSGINNGPEGKVLPVSGRFIAGIKPKNLAAYDAYVEQVKAKVKSKGVDLTPFSGTDTVETVSYDYLVGPQYGKDNKEARIVFAKFNGWVLIGVGESSLTDFLQRATKKKTGASLAGDALVKKAFGKLHKDADANIIFNAPPLIKLLSELPDREAAQLAKNPAIKMMGVLGSSAKFKGSLIEDRYAAVLLPTQSFDVSKFSKACPFDTLKYTSPATVLYAAQSWDLPAIVQLYSTMEFEEHGQKINFGELINKGRESLKKINLDLDSIIAAFGDENAFVLDWDGKSLPEAGIFLKLAKPENLAPVYTLALAGLGDKAREIGKVTVTVDTIGGNKVAFISYQDAPYIPPTVVTLGGPVLGIFSNKEAAERYLTKPAAPTSVVDQPQFKEVLPDGITGKGYVGVTYLNTPAILNQASPHLRKAYGDYSPMMGDAAPEFSNLTLPEKLVVPDLITAWALTQKFEGDVGVSVSVSGIGNQLIPIYGFAIGAGVAVQNVMKSLQPPAEPLTPVDVKGADAILEELDTLRTAVESYEEKAKPKKGYAIKWSDVEPHLIPGTRLAGSGGKDALGNPFVLGKIGGPHADVSKATKAAFPDKNAAFWANEDDEDEKVPSMEADQKKSEEKTKDKPKGKGGLKLEQ